MSEKKYTFLFVDRIGAHAIWGVIAPVAEVLVKHGYRVVYVRMDDGSDRGVSLIPSQVEVYDIVVPHKRRWPDVIFQHWVFYRKFSDLIEKVHPDVVHSHFAVPSALSRYLAKRSGVPFVISTQHEISGSMRWYYRIALLATERYCDAVTYVSDTVARSFGFDQAACHVVAGGRACIVKRVIQNGIDVISIKEVIANERCRTPGRIVCAGRMVPIKGQQYLIEALPDIVRLYPNVHVDMIGEGPMEDKLRRRIDELDLQAVVTFHGWLPRNQLLEAMAKADLVVVPSVQEGYGLIVAEALVCGTRLLVSDIPAFREVLAPFDGCYEFFEAGNVASLKRSLLGLLEQKIDVNCEDKVVPEEAISALSSGAMAQQYLDLYLQLLQGDL